MPVRQANVSTAPESRLSAALNALEQAGERRNVEGMARYGIRSPNMFGVSMPSIRNIARGLGRDHALAAALWESGWHEARILAILVDNPAEVSPEQMDAWAGRFDNWAVCDSACLHLFARISSARGKALDWSARDEEFVKRAGFALMAALAVHDRKAGDDSFLPFLEAVEREAADPRNFVSKAVNWALRQIGKRNLALNSLAIAAAHRIASKDGSPSARRLAHDALRELTGKAVQDRLGRRR